VRVRGARLAHAFSRCNASAKAINPVVMISISASKSELNFDGFDLLYVGL
jgi:hypothetical protein